MRSNHPLVKEGIQKVVPIDAPLTRDQALTLISPWLTEQRTFFINQYNTDDLFRARWNDKLDTYRKDPMIIVNADASQAEVRVAAALSEEPKLIELYRGVKDLENQGIIVDPKKDFSMRRFDFHFQTASYIFHKPIETVTEGERRYAKTISFAVLYGAGEWKIALSTNLSIGEAKKLLSEFWTGYPKIREWVNLLVAEGVSEGYVSTPYGRRKATPTLKDKRDILKCFVQDKSPYFLLKNVYPKAVIKQALREIRQARNFPVQSFTSDMVTCGTWSLLQDCKKRGIEVYIHTIVHDSIVASVHLSQLREFLSLMKHHLEEEIPDRFDVKCPLKIDQEVGLNYDSEIKLPALLDKVDWDALPEMLYQKFRKLKSETIITSVTANSMYLFEKEHRKPSVLTHQEEEIASISSAEFAARYDEYQQRWNLTDPVLEETAKQLRPVTEDIHTKEEEVSHGS